LETKRNRPCSCRYNPFCNLGRWWRCTFGPQPRSHAKDMPRKARRLALRCALSAKVAAKELVVIDNMKFDAPKTKNVVEMLKAFESVDKKNLIITNGANANVELSARNMPKVTTINNGTLNCFDLLNNNKVFLDKEAIKSIEEVLA
jgi:large subunit ribosomal protein L4